MNDRNSIDEIIVVSGMGIFTPLGRSREGIAEAISNKETSISKAGNYDSSALLSDLVSEFSKEDQFGLSPDFCHRSDRGVWFSVKALEEAMAVSGLEKEDLDRKRTAVVVGTSHSGIQHVEKIFKARFSDTEEDVTSTDFYAALTDHVATRVCEVLELTGPKFSISSACSSSNTAVGYGRDLILTGQADKVIVVGTDTVSESIAAGFNSLRVLSTSPAAPFSTPSGISLGEGAGVLILEKLDDCERRNIRPICEVLGYALSSDAYHQTSVDEDGEGIARAIEHSMINSGVGVSDIDYVSAHGTGTDSNDVPESKAMLRIFGSEISVSSVKSSVGHTLGASGVVELIISLVMAGRGLLPPTANFNQIREGCAELNYVPNEPQPADVRTILCNNYGFGGNNSSLVVSRQPKRFQRKKLSRKKVFITAYGNHSAKGKNAETWLSSLLAGESIDQNDESYNTYVGKVPRSGERQKGDRSRRESPSIKYALEAMQDAISGFGLADVFERQLYETGVVAGLLHGAQNSLEKYMSSVFQDGLAYASSTQFPLTTLNAAAGKLSIKYGIKGFNTTFCGSVSAIKFAYDCVSVGHQDRMVGFSTDETTPMVLEACSRFGILGQFDNGVPGSGFYLSEGASVALIESEEGAAERGGSLLAEIAGFSTLQDGTGHELDPSGYGLSEAAKNVLCELDMSVEEIDLVIGVGQGTSSFIKNEAFALERLFGSNPPEKTSVAMHCGYSPTAIYVQMLNYGTSILNGSGYWVAEPNEHGVWLPGEFVRGESVRNVLIVFTSITLEHSALVLRKVSKQ